MRRLSREVNGRKGRSFLVGCGRRPAVRRAGLAKRQPGLPRSAGVVPGDMMMDWVFPRLRRDATAHSLEAVRVALHGKAGGGGQLPLAGAGRVIPIG
jgi:hypothetical protein